MNENFSRLEQEKQDAIVNAALRVFSASSYKHATTDQIAQQAGISKGLLFHYFESKKGLYLFLYQYSIQFLSDQMSKLISFDEHDFFQILIDGQYAKTKIMERHPYLLDFLTKAYCTPSPEVSGNVGEQNRDVISKSSAAVISRADHSKFKEGVDVEKLLKIVLWCAEGFMKEAMAAGPLNLDEINREFSSYLEMLRKQVYKEEFIS